ncbi:MAG: hypothetical protein BMS9Abin08_0065 [Gammaproteobacteria bacterium]|nr:MAG: hypothetical protein BMS9Abin08_0065 [Gammaproteobacteria bacterium]
MKCSPHLARHFQNASLQSAILILLIVMTGNGLALADDNQPSIRDRFTEVDREIQAVKQEVLGVNREILLLEEQLLYPHGQQLVVFVSLSNNYPVKVSSISLELDGRVVSQHIYTRSEEASLHKGGIHRLYTGRLQEGAHIVDVSLSGMGMDGQQFLQRQSTKIIKGSGRKVVELNITAGDNETEPQFSIHEW